MGESAAPDAGVGLHVQVGKIEVAVANIDRNLGGQIEKLSQQLDRSLAEFRAGYATLGALGAVKDEVVAANKRIDGIWSTISWTVKIIVGAVLAGLMGLLFAKGGVRP